MTAYTGSDGGKWKPIGSATIAIGTIVYLGIAVTSHEPGTLATALVSQASVQSLSLPSSLRTFDVGAPAIAGVTGYAQGVYTILGAGADIWATSDQFHFVYRSITGDADVVARVASVGNTSSWAKAGVMIRESLGARSRHAYALTSSGQGCAFERRIDPGGFSDHTSGGACSPPRWVRLVRTGFHFEAFRSGDGLTWTSMGSDTIPMPGP